MRRLCITAFLILSPLALISHPGDGIAVDSQGNIYFTDVNARTIWKYTTDHQLKPVVRDRWSHGLCIDSLNRLWIEVEVNNTLYSVKRISPDGVETHILGPVERGPEFYGVNLVADSENNLYFPYSEPPDYYFSGIRRRSADGTVSLVAGGDHYGHRDGHGREAGFTGINAMRMIRDGSILAVDGDSIRKIGTDGTVSTIYRGIKAASPEDQPFDNGNPAVSNRLYGLDADSHGNIYVAYHGNRRIMKITPNGVESVYRSRKPWSPVGVVVFKDSIIVKESGLEPHSDSPGPRIRKIAPDGAVSTLVTVTPEN